MGEVAKLHDTPPAGTSGPRVYTAIAAVMEEMAREGIGKDRSNSQQGYKFRGIDDVYNALAPVLAKHRLCIIPHMLSRECVERQTAKGGTLFYVTCGARFTLVSAEDGSQVEAVTYGEAMDSGDKATNKAMSAAYKYMAMQTFCIPTEGDNDADGTTHDVAPRQTSEGAPDDGAAERRAIDHLNHCSVDAGTFKDAWEKNKGGWKATLSTEAYTRVVAEMKRLAGMIKAKDIAPKTPTPQEPSNRADEHRRADAIEGTPFDDEIPL